MKTLTSFTLAFATLALPVSSFAIEGLKIANPETYIIQYRANLANGEWQTLTDYFPAAFGTNTTVFIHSNVVQHPGGNGGGMFSSSTMP